MLEKTKFVQLAESQLKAKLEGKSFKKTQSVWDQELGIQVESERDPASYVEGVSKSILSVVSNSVSRVKKEPNGNRSFPDLRTYLEDADDEDFEVKSWYSNARGWAAAGEKKFKEAVAARNPKYLDTWYIDYDLIDTGDEYLIRRITIGRIWDFSTGSKFTGSSRSFRSDGDASPATFIANAIPGEKDRIWALKHLGLS